MNLTGRAWDWEMAEIVRLELRAARDAWEAAHRRALLGRRPAFDGIEAISLLGPWPGGDPTKRSVAT